MLDVLQFTFPTDRTGRFTSTIKTVRCDLEIWWVGVVFIKLLDVILLVGGFFLLFFHFLFMPWLLFYFAPFNLFKSHSK